MSGVRLNNQLLNHLVALCFGLSFIPPVIQCYECTRSASAINSVTLKRSQDDLHTEDMMCPPQINFYVVVGKESGHTGGQREHYDAYCVTAAVSKKAPLQMKRC